MLQFFAIREQVATVDYQLLTQCIPLLLRSKCRTPVVGNVCSQGKCQQEGREYTGIGEVSGTLTEAWEENDWCQQDESCVVRCQNCVPSCRIRQYQARCSNLQQSGTKLSEAHSSFTTSYQMLHLVILSGFCCCCVCFILSYGVFSQTCCYLLRLLYQWCSIQQAASYF